MSEPSIFTFGVAKYVYASAYDDVKSENEKLKAEIAELRKAVITYLKSPTQNQQTKLLEVINRERSEG